MDRTNAGTSTFFFPGLDNGEESSDGSMDSTSSEYSVIDESNNENDESTVSDCESVVSGVNSDQYRLFDEGFIRLVEGDKAHDLIQRRFISGLGSIGTQTEVVAIHRNEFSGLMARARVNSFQIYTRSMETKHEGNANVKYAWYGASSREEIVEIISHGFGYKGKPPNNGLYGFGVYLSPDSSPLESVKNSVVTGDGLRHLLLCRVILGKAELVRLGSKQCHPSSEEYDTGVDDFLAPKKYIVWSTHMNTHILPEYVISFRAPSMKDFVRTEEPLKKPTSPWMPFPTLISVLSKLLPPTTVVLISKYYKNHQDKKISRSELIQQVRKIAGDKLLIAVIKSFRAKGQKEGATCFQ